MKTFKTILAAVLFLSATTGLMAQSTDNSVIEANAHVIQAISVSGDRPLEFGTVVAGTSKTIALDGTATADYSTSVDGFDTESAGRFIVSAAATSGVSLSFTQIPSFLSSGTATMAIEYTAGFGIDESGNSTTQVDVEEDETTSIASFPSNTIGDANGIYVFLGGTVTAEANQEPGSYTANVTLTAEYN